MKQRTLAIVKPDAVSRNITGKIIAHIEKEGFKIVAMKLVHLTKKQAEGFYAVHKERPFFGELTDFMSRGPCVPMILERDDAILKWRDVMGKTDPKDADAGTIRKLYAESKGENCVHGSDAPETPTSRRTTSSTARRFCRKAREWTRRSSESGRSFCLSRNSRAGTSSAS